MLKSENKFGIIVNNRQECDGNLNNGGVLCFRSQN